MAPLRFKAQLLRQRLARYTLAAAAIVLSANFQLARGQSTASTSFWTGEANGNWNTLGNWNFGAANADATTLPQDQATSTNRKVLFTDEPGFLTTIRSITLGSSLTLDTTADAFTVRNGVFAFDLNGNDLTMGGLVLGSSTGGVGTASFTNSGASPRTITFGNLTLWSNGQAGSGFNFGTAFASNVNTVISGGILKVGSSASTGNPPGGAYDVNLAGRSMAFTTLTLGQSATDAIKVSFSNSASAIQTSTLTFTNLTIANASAYGTSHRLFGTGVTTATTGTGTFTVSSTGGQHVSFDLNGQTLNFTGLTLSDTAGGTVKFTNTSATTAQFSFKNLTIANASGYGSTLRMDEFFGNNITATQSGSGSFSIQNTGGNNLTVDLRGMDLDITTLTIGATVAGNSIGKVGFTNSNTSDISTLAFTNLLILSTAGYGSTFSLDAFFGQNVSITHRNGAFNLSSTGGISQQFDLAGKTYSFGALTLGSLAGNIVKLSISNSSTTAGSITFKGLTVGSNNSSDNEFGGVAAGANAKVEFDGTGALVVGGNNSFRNTLTVLGGASNIYSFTTASIGASNTTTVTSNAVIVDGGTLNLNGAFNIQGGYYVNTTTKSDNKLHVKNGGEVFLGTSGTPGTFTTTIAAGSSLIVEGEGSLYKAWSTGGVTAGNGSEIIAKDGGGIQVAGTTTLSSGGLLRVTGEGSYYTGGGTFTLNSGAKLEVLDAGVFTISKTGANVFDVTGKVLVDNGSLIDVAGGARINHASGIDLLNGSSMTVKEKLTIGNSVKSIQTISSGSVIATTDSNLGGLTMANASEVIVSGAGSELYIAGEWTLTGDSGGAANAAQGKVTILNDGKFSLGSFGVASSTYTLPVVGKVYFTGNGFTQGANDAGKSYTANIGSGTTVVLEQGTFYNWSRGTLRVLTGGVLAGSSSSIIAEGGVNLIGGEINPGDGTEIGKLAMGSLNLGAPNSKLSFDIAGDQAGEYDQIAANTFLTNNHAYTVALRVAEGFSATDQMVFQLMNIAVANVSTSIVTWDLSGAALTGSLDWDVSQFKETGVVSIYDTAATGNDSRLFLGAVEPTGGQTTTLPNARVLVGSSSYVEFDLNNSGTDGTSYSVSASGSITSPDATSGTAWVDGAKIRVGFDTSSTGAKGSGTLTIDNLAGSYNGGNPNSGSRDQNDTITVGNVSVVGNRDISAQSTADLGKVFVDTDTQDTTVSLSGGSQDDNNGTRVILSGSGTTVTSNGITAASTSLFNSVFNGANQIRDILLHGNFATSGSKSGTMNVAGLLADGESASLGATVDSSVQVNYTAQVYQRASIVVGVPHEGPLDAGETLQLGNLDTTDGGQRAAGEIVSRELSGDGWTFTGLNLGTVLGQNTAASGTFGFNNGMLLNGTVRTGALVLGLQHADQSIRGASAGDLGTVTVNLKHTVTGQTAAYGVQYSTGLTLGQSFAGLGLTSSSSHGTTATLLGGATSHATTLLTMSFDQAPGAGATFLSDILELSGTGTDTFVLSLTYDPLLLDDLQDASPGAIPVLGWLGENDEWVNAVLGNTGMPDDWETLFSTYYREGAYQSGYDLGTFGWDASTNTVWAVLNHNSEFGVIGAGAVPEPGRALLLAAGLAAAFLRRRRNPRLRIL